MQLEKFLEDTRERFQSIPSIDARAKVGTGSLISLLVFFFSRDRGNVRTLDSIRLFVQKTLKISLSRGGFWERLATNKLREILETFTCSMVQSLSFKLLISKDLLKLLGVSTILLIDSSSSTLPKSAKNNFPAPRNNVAPAAVKLHLCFDIFKGAIDWFQITEATSHDRVNFPPLSSLVGKLIIFDLGYWDYGLLNEIKTIGGFFLSRVKTTANIEIIKVISGIPKKFEGWELFDRRFPNKKSKIVEIIGQFSQNYKPLFEARVIGFWNPDANKYHWYVTNLMVPAEIIYPLYRFRWQIELIFKSLKGSLRLADVPTANPNIICSLVLVALIATMIAYPIANILVTDFKSNKTMTLSVQRAAKIIANCSQEFIRFFLSKSNASLHQLKEVLVLQKKELFDPNWRKRKTTLAELIELAENYG